MEEIFFDSVGCRLRGHLVHPPVSAVRSPRPGLVLCHGFPIPPMRSPMEGEAYPELAERFARDANWTILTFAFRGAGGSGGEFSLRGWLTDLHAAIARLREERVSGVYLAGFGTGGSLAICAAADDLAIQGVAALASPADFDHWASDPRRFLERARSTGAIDDRSNPELDRWVREFREIRAVNCAPKLPPRPLLVVHGSEDETVDVSEARVLVDAAESNAELRVIVGAGHRLRHDPRAIAILHGWLHRQPPVSVPAPVAPSSAD